MLIPLLILVAAVVLGVLASILMSRASDRSAFWNMVLGAVLAVGVLLGAFAIAYLLATTRYPF